MLETVEVIALELGIKLERSSTPIDVERVTSKNIFTKQDKLQMEDLKKSLDIIALEALERDLGMDGASGGTDEVNQTNQHLSNELNKANETNQQLDRQLADANTQINQLKSDQAALKIHLPPNNSSTPNSKEHQTDERTKELQHELASSRKSVHELKNKFASYLKQ